MTRRNRSNGRTTYSVGDAPGSVVVRAKGHSQPLTVRMTFPELARRERGRVSVPLWGEGATGALHKFALRELPATFAPFEVASHHLPARFVVEGLPYEVTFTTALGPDGGPVVITELRVSATDVEGVTREKLVLPVASLLTAALMASSYVARVYPANYDGELIGWPGSRLTTDEVTVLYARRGERPTERAVRATMGRTTGRPHDGGALMSDAKLGRLAALWNEARDDYAHERYGRGRVAYVRSHPELNYHPSRIAVAVRECRRRGLIPPSPRTRATKSRRKRT